MTFSFIFIENWRPVSCHLSESHASYVFMQIYANERVKSGSGSFGIFASC